MKIEKILQYLDSALFIKVVEKALVKTLNKLFHCFSLKTSTCESKREINNKSYFSARAGKIHLRSYDI